VIRCVTAAPVVAPVARMARTTVRKGRPRVLRRSLFVLVAAALALAWVPAAAQPVASAPLAGVLAQETPTPAPTPAPPSGDNLTVYAASSLTNAYKEIGALYTQRTGWNVDLYFGASSTLRTQIEQGAVADVFASADTRNMDALVAGGLASGDPLLFARNRIVVVLPKDNPAGIMALQDLGRPGVKVVTTDPSVPIGQYTLQVLDKLSADPAFGADFRARVEANVVSREPNVRAVLGKVSLGEADASLVYVSDVLAAGDSVRTLDIPDQYNVIATYPMVGVKGGRHLDQAQLFISLVLSDEGQAILARYNFIPIQS
jgi:molybdate transport system substrate-binding protein